MNSEKFIKSYLVAILLFLPFQKKASLLVWNHDLSRFINFIDEITICVVFPLALFKLYKNKRINEPVCLALLFSVAGMVLSGGISGVVNGNTLIITAAGVFDYIKNILVIFVYFAYFTDLADFKKIFRLLLAVAVIMGVAALIQEIWALGSLYIFKQGIDNPNNYIFQKEVDISLLKNYWRFGIFRTSSLMVSTINSGLYGLLILNIYLCITKRVNPGVVISLFGGIFTSVSRIVYMGFVLISGVQVIRGRRWLTAVLVPVVIIISFMSTMWDLNVLEMLNEESSAPTKYTKIERTEDNLIENEVDREAMPVYSESEEKHYREYTRAVALEIWKDHPFWGVGPGMFGGVVSIIFNSHIYNEYNFLRINYLRILKSIDNFWLQVLAETGLAGTAALTGIFFTMMAVLFISRKYTASVELNGLFTGLIIYEIVIILYTLGLSLNIPSIFYTYCALTGIGFGCLEKA
jgi:hypothetical protein